MVPFFSISSKRWNEEPPSEWPTHSHPLAQESHLGPAAWSLNKLCPMWVWCVWLCWFFCLPMDLPLWREHICWPLGCWLNCYMLLDAPWDKLFLLLPDLLCMVILSHIHQLLNVNRSCLFSFFCVSIINFVALGVPFLGWLRLEKGTATAISQVHLHPYIWDLHSRTVMFLAALSTLPNNIVQFVCCWTLC